MGDRRRDGALNWKESLCLRLLQLPRPVPRAGCQGVSRAPSAQDCPRALVLSGLCSGQEDLPPPRARAPGTRPRERFQPHDPAARQHSPSQKRRTLSPAPEQQGRHVNECAGCGVPAPPTEVEGARGLRPHAETNPPTRQRAGLDGHSRPGGNAATLPLCPDKTGWEKASRLAGD